MWAHGLVRRGLRAPMLVVTDGARGLIRAIEELWPDSHRQRCTVDRWRNVAGKLPKSDAELHERVDAAYWATLDEATAYGEARLRRLIADLERSYPSAAACLAEDLPALCVHLEYPLRLRPDRGPRRRPHQRAWDARPADGRWRAATPASSSSKRPATGDRHQQACGRQMQTGGAPFGELSSPLHQSALRGPPARARSPGGCAR